ncbi:MAG: PAS domain S-box protein [Sideroxyarcus sp.]|nr:PAS domain S-box protein [Sideroxyarcus sp.]
MFEKTRKISAHDPAAETAAGMTESRRLKTLLKTGALQKAILNSANFSSIATDEKGVIQIFNIGAERMLGYAAADVLNRITPADISDPQEVIARAAALSAELGTAITPGFEALVFKASRGIEDIYELTYVRKDGSRFPAIVSVTALRDAQDGIIGYLLIGTDNTARKQAEAERQRLLDEQDEMHKQLQQTNLTLQVSEERLAVTLNSIGDAVIATDAGARVTMLNPLAEKLTGWSAAQAIGHPVDEVFHIINQETRAPSVVPVKATLEHGTIQGLANHTIVIARDGSECAIADSCAPIRDRDGRVIGAVLVFRDVTDEYRAQQALRDNATLIQTVLNTVADGIITFHADSGIIETCNPAAEKMFGYPAIDLVGRDFNMLIPEQDRDTGNSFLEYYNTSAASRALGLGREVVGLRRDGSTFPMEVAVSEMWLRGKRYFTGILRDITERDHLDRVMQGNNLELQIARSVADKANHAKSEFLSRMSHELRTPLNAILGFAQLLQAGTPLPTVGQSEKLHQITKAGWYLLELINEILDLAVIESGKLSLSRESVSLTDVMHECEAMVEAQAQKHDVRLSFVPFDKGLFTYADRTRVKQILINLLTNAIKYNCKHGTVTVDCSAASPERIRISIRDSGAGLSPKKLEQLFQPFNRLGQENGTEEGTGMGLVVAKQLVELMGGAIGVTSSVGTGSEFWIELMRDVTPQRPAENRPGAESEPLAQPNAALRTLLYVEDNPANLMLVEHIIKGNTDVRMLSARDGYLGIALAREHLPDVILMDINLPGMSGIEALKILLVDPATKNIPVVALSANAMQCDIERGLEAGFFRYLTKPIRINEFMTALDDALKYSQSKSDNSNEKGNTPC